MTTAEQLAQLRSVAERAACGRWELSFPCDSDSATIDREVEGFIPICVVEGAHPDGGYDEDFQSEQQANAEFIAAFHPAVALALLDELESTKRDSARWFKAFEKAVSVGARYEERIAELEGRTVTVKPPAYVDGNTLGYGEVNHMIDLCVDAFERACHVAGINLTVEG